MHLSGLEYAIALCAIAVGAVVQGSIGFGLNLLSAPVVAILNPHALPATLVLLALPLSTTTALRERHAIDRRPLRWMLLGALPGTAAGVAIVRVSSGNALAVVVGAIALVGVGLSIVTPPIRIDTRSAAAAGFVSQSFGTAASVGGPPVALLYQHHGGPVIRSTLGTFFAVTGLLSIAGLLVVGKIALWHVVLACALTPAMVAGFWCSRRLHGHVDRGFLRPAILALSALAGAAAIVNGLL
ncbi:MAG TPA: sulfite exporter TauE/SafE family protein [Acidimicrobiia bacterium]|nr:sulfite exporter TauE/SafE family protein [Acidimicrobiia bacterium]